MYRWIRTQRIAAASARRSHAVKVAAKTSAARKGSCEVLFLLRQEGNDEKAAA
jgi:hypothetical protein